MQTEEFAKNPIIKANVKCMTCKQEFDINEMIQERPMPYPNNTTVEGVLICPNCGHVTHNYYMTESLRHDQTMLKKAVMEWQKLRTPKNWREYTRRHRVFQNNFDRTQERCKEIFAKEPASEQPRQTQP